MGAENPGETRLRPRPARTPHSACAYVAIGYTRHSGRGAKPPPSTVPVVCESGPRFRSGATQIAHEVGRLRLAAEQTTEAPMMCIPYTHRVVLHRIRLTRCMFDSGAGAATAGGPADVAWSRMFKRPRVQQRCDLTQRRGQPPQADLLTWCYPHVQAAPCAATLPLDSGAGAATAGEPAVVA